MSETQSGSDHQVLGTRGDEVVGSAGKHRGYPRLEDGSTVGPEFVPLTFVRDTRCEGVRSASRLRAQCAKHNNVYVFSVEEFKAACDQVSQVAACVLGQTGGLPGDVVLHLLKGILEGIASLRGEGCGQKAPAGDGLTDVADHRDLEVLKGVVAHVSNRGPPQAV